MLKKRFRISKEEEQELINKKRDSLNLSIREGSACSIMNGAGNSFISPFALALNANNLQIGFLSSFIGLIGPLAQLKSARLMEKFSRKKIVITTVFLQSLMWIPLILLAFAYYFEIWVSALPILLIIFYSILIGIGAIAEPVWFSWMGDLVPEDKRGRYFSKRSKITGFISMISMLTAGFILDYFKSKRIILAGFIILFFISMLARLYSASLFKKHYAPDLNLKKGYYFSFLQFLSRGFKTNFGKFVFFVGLIHFAVAISGPFFTVYMLKELNFSYLEFTAISLSSSVFSLISLSYWGKFSDKYGNRLVILISTFFIPFVPLLWIFSASKLYLIFVPGLMGGIAWGGFNLSVFNFIYDSSTQEHRALCATYYHVVIGIGIFLGSILGGFIAKFSSVNLFGSVLLFLFLISGILRALVALIFLPQIKEVRKTKKSQIFFRGLRSLHILENGFNNFYFYNPLLSDFRIKKLKKVGRFFLE